MPGFDGTGPDGAGPMTGGARGYCAVPLTRRTSDNATGYPYRTYANAVRRNYPGSGITPFAGFLRRRGRMPGRGRGRWFR